ncbi:hypothetical protein J4Q44_G00096290 [Coregonus suidteri]|uniref:UPAR/Ly6 domain-containing protein n=1 Tax=Coregonus suidteri TaxID=861788 RepID=A0AAN8M3L1_9TELE
MKLILTLSLICTLFCSVEMLQCFNCIGAECGTNQSLVTCPDSLNKACLTATETITGSINTTQTIKVCSPISNCGAPLNSEATVSVNLGFTTVAYKALCCNTDGCNKNTLLPPAPSSQANGRQCPSCSSPQDTVCNSPVACLGVEDKCFSTSVKPGSISSTTVNLQGCTTSNVCNAIDQLLPLVMTLSDINVVNFTCKTAPNTAWSIRLSLVPLLLGLTISKLI